MAYDTGNPPRLVVGRFAGVPATTTLSTVAATQSIQGGNFWYYCSTNLATEASSASFFTNGWNLGMRCGDIVQGVFFSSAGSTPLHYTGVIGAAVSSGCGFNSTASMQCSSQ